MTLAKLIKGRNFSNRILFFLFLLEVLYFTVVTLQIPSDPANAVFLGYTASRLVILAVFLVLFLALILAQIFIGKVTPVLSGFFESAGLIRGQSWVLMVLGSVLWFLIWLPVTRFPELQEEVLRLRPLILTVLLILFELVVYFRIILHLREIWCELLLNRLPRKYAIWFFTSILAIIGFYVFLRLTSTTTLSSTLLFSSGPFIGPLQAFLGLVIFLCIFLITPKEEPKRLSKPFWIGLLISIFIVTICVWIFTPFTCADDRPGPFPPNNICYPQVDDSVYSVGSHYITLGRGVLNQWFTDKPFYMVFLAIGQFIFGQEIDSYLIFQILILAIMPIFLFLLGRKFSGLAGGFLAAFLAIVLGSNNIRYYATAGGVNVKIENTETLTGFLLVLCVFFLIKFMAGKGKAHFLLLSGGMLGLSSLTRVNPVFILPFLIVLLLIQNWRKWRHFATVVGILLLGFLITFTPGLLSSRDEQGHFYYLEKIEKVLNSRYKGGQTSIESPTGFVGSFEYLVRPPDQESFAMLAGYHNDPLLSNSLPGQETLIKKFQDSEDNAVNEGNNSSKLVNRLRNIFLTSANNFYLSFTRLPVYLTLHSISQIIKLPDSVTSQKIPMWQMTLSFENYAALFLTLLLVVSGAIFSFSKWNWAGLAPLFMFIGYHIGNGAALTSGERYLEPVQWVVLLYASVGVYSISRIFKKKNAQELAANVAAVADSDQGRIFKGFGNAGWAALGVLIVLGALLPLTSLLNNKITARRPAELRGEVRLFLKQEEELSQINLQKFLKSENAVIVEGIAYHPRQYNSPIMRNDADEFELTVLGEKKVFISNYFGDLPADYFTTGSRVILIGCIIREKTFWGVETVIINTKGLIQLDHEKSHYFVKPANFYCPKN